MKKSIIFSVLAVIALSSCSKKGCTEPTALNYSAEATKDDGSCNFAEETTPTPTNFLVGTGTTAANETVNLYADASLTTGYTRLYVEVLDNSGDNIDNATVTFSPLMDMGTMQHSCPIINPTYNASTKYYEGVAIFQMSSMGGTWTIDVVVNGQSITLPISVDESPTKVVGSYLGDDAVTYIVSLERPETWVTGMNDLKLYVHKKETMMSWPAVIDLDIVLYPEMVSMGHSSTGNVDPVHIANGLYQGTVNLSMAGDWRLHLELSRNSTLVHSDAFLDILF
jgi:hypothetical protein